MIPLFLIPEAEAHRPGLSYARIDPDALTLTFARPELAAKIPMDDLNASRVLIADLTVHKASVTMGGQPCTLDDPTITPAEGDGITIRSAMTCPATGDGEYTAAFLKDFEAGHRQYVQVGEQPVAVLDAANASTPFTAAESSVGVATKFVGLGIEHIWTGYDHLLFLTGLLLAAPRLKDMLFVVTGFTVAHSITLSLAALGYVTLSPRLVEPAIAASIAFVGIENLWKPPARRRVAITFLLGLIHGFGFAGLLRELGLPRNVLALALVSFNGGVEIGQACVVAVVLPLLLWLRRFPAWEGKAVPVGSIGVALAGAYWFVTRIAGG